MVVNRLITVNRKLNLDFANHIKQTKNLCIYKLGDYVIPKNIFFPNASALTLINCSSIGILKILDPRYFPNLNTINYLSMSTGNYAFHHRFSPNTNWIFPDKNYEYYNFMVEMGYGKKDPELLKRYISNKKIVDGKSGFDISYELDLNIPDFGIVNGEWWRAQFFEYLSNAQTEEKILHYFPVINRVVVNSHPNSTNVTEATNKPDVSKGNPIIDEEEVVASFHKDLATLNSKKLSLEEGNPVISTDCEIYKIMKTEQEKYEQKIYEQEKEENESIPAQIDFYTKNT